MVIAIPCMASRLPFAVPVQEPLIIQSRIGNTTEIRHRQFATVYAELVV